MHAVIGVTLIAILASLGSALYYMAFPSARSPDAMATALTVRITLSVAMFIMLMVMWMAGVIEPHGVGR